ncbi:MAG: universal stress protein [Rhodospirillales bacterium]|nr:universal stress protein [Rhodospirillales bacterium]
MSGFKTMLVAASDQVTSRSPMETAFLVGDAFGSHVKVMHVRTDPTSAVPLVGEGMSGAMVEEMIDAAEAQSQERAAATKRTFEQLCSVRQIEMAGEPPATKLTATWREEVGREEDMIARCGRLYDLIVVGRPLPDRELPSIMTLNAGLMETGRPLLVAPPEPPAAIGRTIAVAWNGSAEAARAIAMAMPFLHRAEKIIVLSAKEMDDAFLAPSYMAGYLAWHGLAATSHTFPGAHNTGETLWNEVRASGADMLVMGAYTHSRLRQLILGGVTRYMLHNATIPLFLSH